MRTAVVIGSTGLIGADLVERLARQGSWMSVLAITRKPAKWASPKIRNLLFDFTNWGDLELQVRSFAGHSSLDFFCCLGTTLKMAGSKEAFRRIDHDAVLAYAELANRCRGEQLFVVSSLGADPESTVFYNRVKGEMETAVAQKFNGKSYFARPSLLLGDREEFRLFERLAILMAPLFSMFLVGRWAQYRPIRSSKVASALVAVASKNKAASQIIENRDLHSMSR